jgi:aminoglycoside phosphotransferase (APT) family kinase protein
MSTPVIDGVLVRRLLCTQFPQWSGLPLRPVEPGGWDNKSFRLGDDMVVRLPRIADYAAQVEKEHRWLPRLAPSLPFQIPQPLAIGEPASGYPYKWAVYQWIDGDTATPERIGDLVDLARSVAQFLFALQRIDSVEGPRPGPHNFYRGGPLTTYAPKRGRRSPFSKAKSMRTPSLRFGTRRSRPTGAAHRCGSMAT